ncbi:MAG: outer membrane protein assembly factor BamB family protein [Thermoguttaceae bacterium]
MAACIGTWWISFSAWLVSAVGQEAAWPRFRGPNGQGATEAASIPVRWTPAEYRWEVQLPGTGHSSPVVWGDRIFVTSAVEKDATQIILCLRTSDGEQLWRRDFPSVAYPKHRFNAFASSTPAADGQHVYVTWASPGQYTVVALAQEDGREIWRRDLGPFVSLHGFGASPIVWRDLLIVPNDQDGASCVMALDCQSGSTRWQSARRSGKASFSTPCIFQPESGDPQLILSSWAHGLTSLEPGSGKINWELPVFESRVVGSPLVAAGLIFAAAGEAGAGKQLVAVQPGDPRRGIEANVAYRLKEALPYVPTPVARGRLVFLWQDRGVVTCLDAPSGKVHWRQRIGGEFFASPIRVGDRLYCVSRTGEMVVLAAAERFELLARFPLGEPSHSTPAVADGVMYLRTASRLMAIGPPPR